MKLSHWIQWSFVWTFVGGVFVECSGEYRTFDVGSGIRPRISVPTGMSLPEAQFASRSGTFDIHSRYWSKSRRGEYPEESEDVYSTLPVDNESMGQFDQMTMGTEQPQVTINKGDMEHTMTITMPRMERYGNRMIKKFVVQPVIQYVVQYDKNEGGEEGSASHFEEYEGSQSQDDPRSSRGDDVERLFNNVDANFESYWGNDENGSGSPYYQEGNNNDFDFSSGDWQHNNINNNNNNNINNNNNNNINNNNNNNNVQQQQQQGMSNGQNGHANGMQNNMHQQNSMQNNMQQQNGMNNNMQQQQPQQQQPPPSLNAFVSVEYPSYQKSPSMAGHNSANGGMSLSNAVQMSNAQQQHSPGMQMNGGGGQMGMQNGQGGPPSGAASMPMQMQQINPMGDMNNGMMMMQQGPPMGMGMPMNSGPPPPPPRTRYGVPGMMPGMPLGSQYGVPGMTPGPPLGPSPPPPQMMMQMQPAPPMPMMSSPQPMMPMQMPSQVPQQQASMPPSTTVPVPMMQMQQQFTSAMPMMMMNPTPQMVSTQQTTTTTAAAPSEGYEPPPPPSPSSTPAPYGPPAESSGGWSSPSDGQKGKKPNRPKGRGRGKSILAHLPKLPASIGGHLSFMFSTGVGKGRRGGRGWKPAAAQGDDKHNKSTTVDREQVSDHILNILGLTVHHSPGHSRINATSLSSFNPIVMWEQLGNETSLNHTSNSNLLQPTILLQGNMLEDTSSPSTPVDRSSDGGEPEKEQVSSTNEVLISANPTNNATTNPLTITTTTPSPFTHNYSTSTDEAQFITTTPISPTPTPTTGPTPVNSIKKDHLIIKPAITLVPFSTLTFNSSRIFPISPAPVPRDTSPSQFQPTPNSPITYIKPIVNMKQVPKLTPHRQFFEVDTKPKPEPTIPSPTTATPPISHLTPPPPPYDAVQEYINQNLSNNLFSLEENYNPKNSTVRPTVHAYYSDQNVAGHPVKVHFDPLIYDALQAAFQPYNKIYESVHRRRRRFYLPSYIDIRSRSEYPKENQQNGDNSNVNAKIVSS